MGQWRHYPSTRHPSSVILAHAGIHVFFSSIQPRHSELSDHCPGRNPCVFLPHPSPVIPRCRTTEFSDHCPGKNPSLPSPVIPAQAGIHYSKSPTSSTQTTQIPHPPPNPVIPKCRTTAYAGIHRSNSPKPSTPNKINPNEIKMNRASFFTKGVRKKEILFNT